MQGIEWEGPEEAFRRGYEHAAIETFHAVSRFLEPAARAILRTWVEDDNLCLAAQFNARLPTDLAFENISGHRVTGRHQRPPRPQSSSASRRTAGAAELEPVRRTARAIARSEPLDPPPLWAAAYCRG
jgi:hypothetical protein